MCIIIIGRNFGTLRRQCRRALICLMGLALILIANTASTLAQGNDSRWPDRPVHVIVPFPAGSASDIVARIIAQKLGAQLGQQFVIDNRAGASGDIGAEAIARAAPDGYTIGLATSSTHVVAASLNPKLSYNPVTDFTPVSMIGTSPYVLAIYPGLPAHNVAELIALAKAKPRALNFASAGPASLAHIAGTLFSRLAGVELTEVPYRSSSQSILDLTEGRIEIQFGTLAPTLGQIRANKARALAVTGPKRIDSLPDLPTLQEAGLKDYDIVLWLALVMPAGSPSAIVARLNRAMHDTLASKDVVAALKVQGVDPEPSTPDALRERIRAEITKWRSLAGSAGLEAEP
jgi:tripartite-type tricarboxylate transporter receptor subunit TctC